MKLKSVSILTLYCEMSLKRLKWHTNTLSQPLMSMNTSIAFNRCRFTWNKLKCDSKKMAHFAMCFAHPKCHHRIRSTFLILQNTKFFLLVPIFSILNLQNTVVQRINWTDTFINYLRWTAVCTTKGSSNLAFSNKWTNLENIWKVRNDIYTWEFDRVDFELEQHSITKTSRHFSPKL